MTEQKYFRRAKVSRKQKRYASLLATKEGDKQDLMKEAGFSASTARVPQVVERTRTFKLAQAEVARETNNATMAMILEIQARQQGGEMGDYKLDELIKMSERLATVVEKLTPKEKPKDTVNPLQAVFRDIDTPEHK